MKKNDSIDLKELVSKGLEGRITTLGFNTTPHAKYYEEEHTFTAVIELPSNITQIIGDGALVVDLKVLVPDVQHGNGVQLLMNGPKLEYVSALNSWHNAETSCVSRGGHLASVPSQFHWLRLKEYISNEGLDESALWLGGTFKEHWRWSDGSKWSDEEHWMRGNGDAKNGYDCVFVKNENWYNKPCSWKKSFLCELPTIENITSDKQLVFTKENLTMPAILLTWESLPQSGCHRQETKGLTYDDVKRTWTEAEATCVSKGGHLASISSPDDWEA